MNISTRFLLPALAVASAALSACNSSDPGDTVTAQQLAPCYAVVTDLNTDEVSYCNDVTFILELNWTNATSKVMLSGLSAGGTALPAFKLPELPWSVNAETQWGEIKSDRFSVTANYSDYTISDFSLAWADRLSMGPALGVPNLYWPGAVYKMVIDDRYRVVGARAPFMFFGKTTSTGPDGKSWDNQNPYYQVALDFTHETADIQINEACFAEQMPAQNMRFLAVPMTIDPESGIISIAMDPSDPDAELIPNIVGTDGKYTPFPDFPIKALSAVIDPAKGMSISFMCNVSKLGLYNVTAETNYIDYTKITE